MGSLQISCRRTTAGNTHSGTSEFSLHYAFRLKSYVRIVVRETLHSGTSEFSRHYALRLKSYVRIVVRETLHSGTSEFSLHCAPRLKSYVRIVVRETLHSGTIEFAFQCVQLKISVTVTARIPYFFIHWCFYAHTKSQMMKTILNDELEIVRNLPLRTLIALSFYLSSQDGQPLC